MLEYTHNGWLVAASLAVALMAGFTGLSITRGASALNERNRKIVVALAAIILGGGIWSMHFVAMLGLQLPILFYYDALITLMSALVAILMVGLALLVLHFRPRTPGTIIGSGVIVGLGIVAMHYIGMAGMQLCRPVYGFTQVVVSMLASVILSVLAIWVAYDERTHRNIILGTLCFGVAVVTMHFVAIGLTAFEASDVAGASGPALGNQTLAMGVTISVFLICSAFLLTGITFIGADPAAETPTPPPVPATDPEPTPVAATAAGIPYEREGQTFFADHSAVAALRAEGHYTLLYVGEEKLFCPWSITEADSRLIPLGFLRCHRSYLINPHFVSGFERNKDNGTCFFDSTPSLPKVPVSRSRMADVRDALGL
ncbi:MHYT domain-containing protein [Phaeobacter marinintestinus]|uniref:MHYT domain-containing protein n=1 Tax=Falsiphaeobacter marinintestinus TaxID=1492905 RepID=UPI0011B36DF9|nr:MHYT domain-containing protein [Phaeobacter marinintestinus]